MDADRPQFSNTLPRNFMFHYRDGSVPRTPEPEPQMEDPQPPPPPRQTLKVRRRRTSLLPYEEPVVAIEERPIPTVEIPELLPGIPEFASFIPEQNSTHLSPGFSYARMVSPPKTPVAQMRTISHYDGPRDWSDIDHANQSETSSRPTSSSGFSDSSVSSCGSIGSFASRGGSCTSPEDDMTDPYFAFSPDLKFQQLGSPMAPQQQVRPTKRLKLRATFSEEMDHHLWMTYMKYLQDPTVTPFKALPSTVPPNGVCHRVARMARKTWKGGRMPRPTLARAGTRDGTRCGTPDTIRPIKSGSSTPIARPSKALLRYPSEKQCRKRLRDLAKQKPSLSAHYQRMLRRSPSPFQSSPPEERPQPQPQQLSSPFSFGSTSFSTRDMNVSLATSTAASMQAGNPLSQLSSDITPRPAKGHMPSTRASAHQKSQSLHVGLGLGLGHVLGSSFKTMSEMTDESISQHNSRTWHAPSSSAQAPRLGSPFQLHAPRPISRVFKRRALHSSFEDKARNRGNSFVDELFGAPAESSHRRVRSRGFSLGDMMEGARRLPQPTTGSQDVNPLMNLASSSMESSATSVGQDQATIRLGSPFDSKSSNTFPRATASHSFEPPASFEQRLAATPGEVTEFYHS